MSFVLITIIISLLIISAFISASETAITATSPGRMQQKKLVNNKKAMIVLKILKIKNKVISSLLIGNSIANTLCTTLATSLFIEHLGDDLGTIASSIVMAFVIIVFAEVVPKAIAVAKAEQISLMFSPVLLFFVKFLNPVNVLLEHIVRFFCFVFRIDFSQKISGEDEVRGVIEHHTAEGNVIKSDRNMLGGVLDIKNMTVEDIMTHRSKMFSINIDLSADEIVRAAILSKHSRIPIWQKNVDNIIGILHIRDLLSAMHQQLISNKTAGVDKLNIQSMLNEPWFIPNNAYVIKQLDEFRLGQSHLACVVDEYGDLQGIVTLEDIVEEVFGQIYDEFDQESPKIFSLQAGEYIIDGLTAIRDINRELDWKIPDDDATTIAGFLVHKMGRIPNQNEQFYHHNILFTILRKSSNRIKTIQAQILKNEQPIESTESL